MIKQIMIYIIGLLIITTGNLYATDGLLAPMTMKQITTVKSNILSIQQHIANIEMSAKEHYVPLTPEENNMIMEFHYDISMLKLRLKLNEKYK